MFNEQKAILVYLQVVSTGEREKMRYFLSAITVPYDHWFLGGRGNIDRI